MLDALTLFILLLAVFAASVFSIRLGISVAIVEIVAGMLLGNFLGIDSNEHDWLIFLAGLGSVVLTFLAGAEIDPAALRKTWKASLTIGSLSFLAPFLIAIAFAYVVLDWSFQASLLAGVALSTTSVAVVYIVLVESGSSKTELGNLILSSCFVTDLGTAVALSVLFVQPGFSILFMVAGIIFATIFVPRLLEWVLPRLMGRGGGEPEVKLVLLMIVGLGLSAEVGGQHAVLPAYILGLVTAKVFINNAEVLKKVRVLTMAFLTPFFFITAGLNVSMEAIVTGAGLIAVLFAVKIVGKFVGVYPISKRLVGKDSVYLTLLMSTGLTFGTISAQYGLSSGIIDRFQFSVLVMVVILTAIIPTIIAQKWYSPIEEVK